MPLVAHFLNVARGDCTLIEFPSGHVGIFDVDNVQVIDPDTRAELLEPLKLSATYQQEALLTRILTESAYLKRVAAPLTDPLDYLTTVVGTRDVFRLVVTHQHMDHLSGLDTLARETDIINFWHAGTQAFDLDTCDWDKSPYRQQDWDTYKRLARSSSDLTGDTSHPDPKVALHGFEIHLTRVAAHRWRGVARFRQKGSWFVVVPNGGAQGVMLPAGAARQALAVH